ncbi:MAG: hypothetical protein JSV39_03365 [Candidatus Aenigmatarchaeota archaeon]|nr:MAG: hypothetical protein JSV39_03365 [Candidatus Aenigmarchaeota archaeon]
MRKHRKFSTKRADYYLYPGTHKTKTVVDENILKNIDALVLESGFYSYEHKERRIDKLLRPGQYERLVKNFLFSNGERDSSIFIVDLPVGKFLEEKEKGYAINNIIDTVVLVSPMILNQKFLLPLLSLSYFGSGFRGKNNTYDAFINYLSLSRFYTSSGLRSAVSAGKTEDFVAPYVEKKKGKRPEILIEYGMLHGDIEPYIKHKFLREGVKKLHSLWRYLPRNREYLDKVCEFSCYRKGDVLNYEQVMHTMGSDKKYIVDGGVTKLHLDNPF